MKTLGLVSHLFLFDCCKQSFVHPVCISMPRRTKHDLRLLVLLCPPPPGARIANIHHWVKHSVTVFLPLTSSLKCRYSFKNIERGFATNVKMSNYTIRKISSAWAEQFRSYMTISVLRLFLNK